MAGLRGLDHCLGVSQRGHQKKQRGDGEEASKDFERGFAATPRVVVLSGELALA